MLRRLFLTGLFLSAPMTFAQSFFISVKDGKTEIVKQIHRERPMVERGGKLVSAGGNEFGLARATVYSPGLVSFAPDFVIRVVHHVVLPEGTSLGYELRAEGRVTSDTTFRDCFIVMEEVAPTEKGLAFAELPDLVAGDPVQLNLIFPLSDQPELANYRVHIFSNGIERLHSKMKPPYLEAQKQKTAALLSGKVRDYPAIFAHGKDAAYPDALKNSGATGTARVRCHVTKKGDVASAELVSASATAFGEAALVAVPKWKFDPAIKGLQFVEADVELPVEFKPPKKS
jgi:TonB family protein